MDESVRNDLIDLLTRGWVKVWDIRRAYPQCTATEITEALHVFENDGVAESRLGARGMEEWRITMD